MTKKKLNTHSLRLRAKARFFLGLSLASRQVMVAGIPILFAYSFLSWAGIILLIAVVTESRNREKAASNDEAQPRLKTTHEEEGSSG